MLYKEFIRYIQTGQILKGRSRLLLAVSGGADSVVLLHLFHQLLERGAYIDGLGSPLVLGIAHCNFHLRGEESNRDENFVRELASRYRLPLHCISFDTEAYAREHRLSIEMAARELRYGFFSRLMQGDEPENPAYDACVLAHHADDNAETFFINLFRGSGVKGLRGMLPVSVTGKGEVYLRPLLFARRNQIEAYARAHSLEYVTDSTNQEEIYLRNKIRHTVLPVLENICEGFSEKLTQSMESLQRVDGLLDSCYVQWKNLCVTVESSWAGQSQGEFFPSLPSSFLNRYGFGGYSVRTCEIISQQLVDSLFPHHELFLELYLRHWGFSRSQIAQVLHNYLSGEPGKVFENALHSVLLLRENQGWKLWELFRKNELSCKKGKSSLSAEDAVAWPTEGIGPQCSMEVREVSSRSQLVLLPHVANLDSRKLKGPLYWRHWQAGDRFIPFGMKGFRKLSDFFKDMKLNLAEKDAVWLLCSGNDIVWVAGYRIDNRYAVDFSGEEAEKKKVLVIELL